jgi:hypothetical protein
MKQASGKIARACRHDFLLPWSKSDLTLVVPAGPCCGNRHGQCLDALDTYVHATPGRDLRNTLDVGITRLVANCASRSKPGHRSEQATVKK